MLDLPKTLKTAAEDFAEREGVLLNQFIALVLAEKVGARRAELFADRGRNGDEE